MRSCFADRMEGNIRYTLRPDKMAAILQVTFSIILNDFSNEKYWIVIQISLTFIRMGPINTKPPLVWIMAWRRTGDKSVSEPTMTHITDAYMRHLTSMSLNSCTQRVKHKQNISQIMQHMYKFKIHKHNLNVKNICHSFHSASCSKI